MELEMLQDGNSIFWSWSGGPSNSENKKIELNIDLNDPDVADAVTKIQAGFRASQARKLAEEAKSKTSHNGSQCFKNPNKVQYRKLHYFLLISRLFGVFSNDFFPS